VDGCVCNSLVLSTTDHPATCTPRDRTGHSTEPVPCKPGQQFPKLVPRFVGPSRSSQESLQTTHHSHQAASVAHLNTACAAVRAHLIGQGTFLGWGEGVHQGLACLELLEHLGDAAEVGASARQ